MSANAFALLADSTTDDAKEIAKTAPTKQAAPVAEQKPAATQNKPQSSQQTRPQSSQNKQQKKPQSPAGEVAEEGEFRTAGRGRGTRGRGGRGGRGRGGSRGGDQDFDRHVSRNARGNRGFKKGGAGGRNWGQPGAEQEEVAPVTTGEETATTPADVPAEGEKVEDKKPEEKEDEGITLEEFLKQKKKVELEKPKARKAGEGVAYDAKEVKKSGTALAEETSPLVKVAPKTEKKEEKKEQTKPKTPTEKKEKVIPITEFLKDAPIPQRPRSQGEFRGERRGGRGGRGGRGAGRGAARGGNRRNVPPPPPVNDQQAFPALA